MDYLMQDTIAAISTPPGEGGIGIIRISGNKSREIAKKILRTPKGKNILLKDRRAHFCCVLDPKNKEIIDEALAIFMPGPKTYTTQDIVEIDCHGGPNILRRVLNLVISMGAKPAEPGEFTKRAFLGGRIDLAQAEAVMDLIKSKTDKARQVALSQLKGVLSNKINKLADEIIDFMLQLEVRIDFCEDDIPSLEEGYKKKKIEKIIKDIDNIIHNFEKGKIFREGLKACITGPPNAGKSTLLNTLLKEERAIVTHIPGTTRDSIEETINLRGIPLILVDTAGIRESKDLVESIGIKRSIEILEQSDITLLIIDGSQKDMSSVEKISKNVNSTKTLVIINKIDLEQRIPKILIQSLFPESRIIEVSLKKSIHIGELEDAIFKTIFKGQFQNPTDIILTNARHKDALIKTKEDLKRAKKSICNGVPDDCITIDLQSAIESLGLITGKVFYEDIIEKIFSQFCIGK